MNISDYVKLKGGRARPTDDVLKRLAKEAGCAPLTLYMIALGHKAASARLAARIEKASEGEVSRFEILWPDEVQEASRRRPTLCNPRVKVGKVVVAPARSGHD